MRVKDNNIVMRDGDTVDGRDLSVDGAKLDAASSSNDPGTLVQRDLDGRAQMTASHVDSLKTPRTISIVGEVLGSISFDGTQDVDITTTIVGYDHDHDHQYYPKAEGDSRYVSRMVLEGDDIVTYTPNYDESARIVPAYAIESGSWREHRRLELTGDVSGFAFVDGKSNVVISTALEAGSAAVKEKLQDTAGALITSGTHTGIVTTYDDENGTLSIDASHDHDERYLGITAKAEDSELLDGHDSTWYSASTHLHDDRYYTEAEIDQQFADLVGGAPETLDSLKEIADSLNNDPNLSTTITTGLATKLDKADGIAYDSYRLGGQLPAYYSVATHDHDATYVKQDGGIITGGITVDGDLDVTGTLLATAQSALYADLAEVYTCTTSEPGTVLTMASDMVDEEMTECAKSNSPVVSGVVSTNPAYLMNGLTDGVPVALVGRVPVRVIGPVTKGGALIAAGDGCAKSAGTTKSPNVIAFSLKTDYDYDERLVECKLKL